MKIDLHVHSCFSRRPSTWLLKKIGCAESYTDPRELYRLAKEKGMDAVTITDHNTIEGALEIADLEDTFIGCEVTAYLPADRCKLHVLVYRINEEQFREIDRLRENVYDLVDYLSRDKITYALAHPIYSVNDRMTLDNFERCLLLFKLFELNGDQDHTVNRILHKVLTNLNEKHLEQLADKYDYTPLFEKPWQKYFIGGSDDHSSLMIARTHTVVAGARTIDEFWETVNDSGGQVYYPHPASPLTMAHNIYGVAYQFYNNKVNLKKYYENSVLMRFVDRMLQSSQRKEPKLLNRLHFRWRRRSGARPQNIQGMPLLKLIQYETESLINQDEHMASILDDKECRHRQPDVHWFRFVNQSSKPILGHLADTIRDHFSGFNPFDIFKTFGSAGALYTLLAPYFVSFAIYSKNRRFSEKVGDHFGAISASAFEPRVGLFTDTLDDINGVALTLKRQAKLARKTGREFTLITCSAKIPGNGEHDSNIRYFESVGEIDMPEYPEQKNYIPPLLEIIKYGYEQNFTHIHAATPGPLGLAALVSARIMRLPLITTYHTAFPEYARYLTDDSAVEELMWRYILWFYDQAEMIFSPSAATARDLIDRGISEDKFRIMPRGVDITRFGAEKKREQPQLPSGFKLLYVGRVSREKNLPLLARVFRKLSQSHPELNLIIVGEGPYLEKMKQELKNTRTHFTGYLEGENLPSVYAQCDLFIFPSTTDTFGNVVLEAQASGLPIIVTDRGGPQENVIAGKTGLIVKADDETAMIQAISELMQNNDKLKNMAESARTYAETRSFEHAFEKYWQLYEKIYPLKSRNYSILNRDKSSHPFGEELLNFKFDSNIAESIHR